MLSGAWEAKDVSSALEMPCFLPMGLTQTAALSKENHRGTHDLALCCAHPLTNHEMEKDLLVLNTLDDKAGEVVRTVLMNTNLEGQLWILLHLANLFPRNGSFENFPDSRWLQYISELQRALFAF